MTINKVAMFVSSAKSAKNGNGLGDLDFDLVTSRTSSHVDLVYTYL